MKTDLLLEYNTARKQLVIPEYGRAVHKMVDYCTELADREERNRCARAIIAIMGNLFPQLRDVEDYRHKLWDHMFIMSDFQLDVDSPYPKPTLAGLSEKPDKVSYPAGGIKYGHYGKVTQTLIEQAALQEDSPQKDKMALQLFSLMRRSYKMWNRDTVEDEVILKQIRELSKGRLNIDPSKIAGLSEPAVTAPVPQHNQGSGNSGGFKKKKWNNNKNNNNRNKKKFNS